MLKPNEFTCKCGGEMKHYDYVRRKTKGKNGIVKWIFVERRQCTKCKSTQRVLPDDILPYKQYEAEIVQGVQEGLITPETLGFEDYPCELTMRGWGTRKLHTSL